MFLNAIRIGDYVYGTTGDFGPAFLTALDINTGQAKWQHRGFGRASLVYADGKAIILDEDGDLALAKLSPEGVTIVSEVKKVFETTSWTAPTLVGTTLFARDREKIVALDLAAQAGSKPLMSAIRNPPSAQHADSPRRTDRGMRPDLSGAWRLDTARSRVTASAGFAGLIGSGAPEALHITQPANATVVVESHINESHSRLYRPGASTTTPVTLGPPGTITMTARWEGPVLIGEGTRESLSGPSKISTDIREAISLSSDRSTLTIDVATTTAGEKSTSTFVYTRLADFGSCKSWPTPCKTWSQP
jgi:hypothetical protein